MSVKDASSWAQTGINVIAALAIAVGGYWCSQQDRKNEQQDRELAIHRDDLIGLKKDSEYSQKAFETINSDMKELIGEVKKLTNEVARLQP